MGHHTWRQVLSFPVGKVTLFGLPQLLIWGGGGEVNELNNLFTAQIYICYWFNQY